MGPSPENRRSELSRSPGTGQLSEKGKRIVIAGRCGRLANRISLFAHFVALAEEQGHQIINCTFHSYAHLFRTTEEDIYCRYPVSDRRPLVNCIPGLAALLRWTRICPHVIRGISVLHERRGILGRQAATFRETFGQWVTALDGEEFQQTLRGHDTVFVIGWSFRASHLVRQHAEKLRGFFRPVERHEQASHACVARLRQEAEVVVGVHVRHGDYATWQGGKYFFPAERYANWMHELAEQFPGRKVSFLVCSNEPRSPVEFPGLSIAFSTGVPVEDLYALAECDYVMGPVSSFTQWSSFYGNKPLLHFTGRNTRADRERFAVSYLAEVPH